MSKFNIGDKVEVVDGDSWYHKIVGVIFSITVDGRYLVGFPNTDYEPFIGVQLKHYYEDKEPEEDYEPVGVSYDFDNVFMHFTCKEDYDYDYLELWFPILGSGYDAVDSLGYFSVWAKETPPFMSFICTEEPEEKIEDPDTEPDELSTTSENLYDIIDHIHTLKDSGAQSIRVTIESEKETEQGFIETYNSYKWECDLDE